MPADGRSSSTRSSPRPLHYKVVLLGESAVGKSCLVLQFAHGRFPDGHEPTMGASFLSKTVTSGETPVKLEIWDTAGQERYQSLAPMYYRGAGAAIVVYSATSFVSYTRAKHWIERLRDQNDMVILLVGNKCDLEEERSVPRQTASEYASSNGLLFAETSAKTADGVHTAFQLVAEELVARGMPEAGTGALRIGTAPSQGGSNVSAVTCCSVYDTQSSYRGRGIRRRMWDD
eukprot:CAMPEP_0185199148 /NCGR_PEP_ID=MMETSP1140-20130426/44497_1 /TAXON_ID=298111 /ORGANISM="Pavlova sp., Strain CCMP459" /LENGTH=230 /DNA_ID=CAMNT_0027766397 /DNA_START=57 /DNA_END=747 /DNA_ORIENTATION=-